MKRDREAVLVGVVVGLVFGLLLMLAMRVADAGAAVRGYEAEAVAYWGQVAPAGVELIESQAELEAHPVAVAAPGGLVQMVVPNELAELTEPGRGIVGRRMWVGVFYAGAAPDVQCAVFVHGYGHLLGLEHVDDGRELVMTTAAVPAVCQALVAVAPVVGVDPAVVAANNALVALDEALTRRFVAGQRRERCLARAAGRSTSRRRLAARRACRSSYRRAVR